MLLLLLLAAMATCDALDPKGTCDEPMTLHFGSKCTSCALIQSTLCPRTSSISRKSTQLPNCRYTVEIGGKSKTVPGCSHSCKFVTRFSRCCPETWGPFCLPCPSWAGRTCNWHGTCMEGMKGNGTCVCEEGYTGFACQECQNKKAYGEHCTSECNCVHGQCNNGPSGDGTCYCKPPYTGPRCDQESTSCRTCGAHSYCKKTGETEACECLPGFKKEGLACTGNMCSLDVCDRNADCTELDAGRYQCRCKVGYEGNGRVCVPINPCTSNNGGCPPNSTVCVYTTPGRSHCACRHGYEGSTPENGCTLISACTPDTCHRTSKCVTAPGGAPRCECDAQKISDGRRCYGSILEQLLELNRGAQKGKLTGAIRLFEKWCQLTLSKYGPFTAFVPVLTEPLDMGAVSESFVCKNHLILQQKVFKELKGKDFWTLGGEELRFEDDMKFFFKKDPYKKYSVILADLPAANGIIHLIDGPITNLRPRGPDSTQTSKMTIGEIIANDPKFKAFQALLASSGLSLPLRDSGSLTVFVPTNDALDKFSHNIIHMQKEARHKLEALVKHHISTRAAEKVEELADSGLFQTIGNDPIYITLLKDGRLEFDESGIHLDTADIIASNGIIHVIDGVLVPTSIQPILQNRCNVTKTKIVLGPCKSCDQLNNTYCPNNGTELWDYARGCTYLVAPYNYHNTKGCAKYCNVNETTLDCCNGFYGEDCKPCLGGFQHPCHDGGTCMDGIHGNGTCICKPQFTGAACHICKHQNKYGENCDQDCRCVHGTCDNRRHSSGRCRLGSCQTGFSGDLCELKLTTCSEYQTETCHYLADCVLNVTGQAACVCKSGYEGDGMSCLSANPCVRPDRGGCDRNAQCLFTTMGTVRCLCTEGWTGDGDVCAPIDNCLLENRGNCHENAECTAVGPGQNECTCMPGYRGDGRTCSAMSPCRKNNGGCHLWATCEPLNNGTVNCTCPGSFVGNGTVCYGSIRMEMYTDFRFFHFYEYFEMSGFVSVDNITVLVPTRSHQINGNLFWKNPYRLPYVIMAHILTGVYSREDLMKLAGKDVPTQNPKTSWKVQSTNGTIMIGNATIVKSDIYATNGFIHIIDRVLFPPVSQIPPLPPTLMEYLNNTPTFSLFRQALLVPIAVNRTSSSQSKRRPGQVMLYNLTDKIKEKKCTILLPSDEAIKEHLTRENSTKLDEDTVRYHIVTGIQLFPGSVRNGMTEKTLLDNHQIMFHVGVNNESMANEVLLDANVTEVQFTHLIRISSVLEIHKNICIRKVTMRRKGRCSSCDESPICYYGGEPIADKFPEHMRSNCKFYKMEGRLTIRASGCAIDCLTTKEEDTCCPGFFGISCFKCPGQAGRVCSGRGQCQDGLQGSGECVCQQYFHGTACETCEPGRYGPNCQSVCSCVHGHCMDGIKGSGMCVCHKGWKGPTCSVEIVADECGGICDVHANCVAGASGSTPTCTCTAGYKGHGMFCAEINPCDENNGDCSKHANCTKTSPGERTCTCHHGYTGDGLVCQERDPCAEQNGGCHKKAVCFPLRHDQVVCKCMEGYSGDGLTCSHVNPCRYNNGGCSENAWCEYRDQGQRNCTCRRGYIGDGFICKGKLLPEVRRHPDGSWFYETYMNSKIRDLNEQGPFTVFVPHKDFVNNSTTELWTNSSARKDVVRNHLVSCEQLLLSDLQPGRQVLTLSGHRLHFSRKEGVVYINEKIKILTSDEIVFNGVFHVIDGVLLPYALGNHSDVDPKLNISAAAEAYGYKTFSKLLQDSSVHRLVESPSHVRQLTMLWPSDHAFQSLSEDLRRWLFSPDHTHYLISYIKAHIVQGISLTAAMLSSAKSVRTLFGSSLSFSCDRNTVGGIVVDGSAKITERHLEFDGGIAYGVDHLLEPAGIGARCDVHEVKKMMGLCRRCTLTPRCWYGTFTGKVTPCQVFGHPWSLHSGDLQMLGKVPRAGCSPECVLLEWSPRCCKNHFGRDCQVCPGGLEAPCSNHGDCDDGQQGTGKCSCHPGFNGTACELCDSGHYGTNCTACSCTENGRCDEGLGGDGSCFCKEGWIGDRCELKLETLPTCTPKCHPKAVCQLENVCRCDPLYEGDGRTCTAPDLCSKYNGGCHVHASCVQTGAQVTCSCQSGYTGDGITCSPINRCVQEENGGCSQFATCLFKGPNERECQCLPGYVGNGVQCLESVVSPVDRCLEENGGCDPKARCKDLHFHDSTAGVFHLSAPEGRYKLSYTQAQAACEAEGATLASIKQLSQAQQAGMHLCMAGWLDGAQVGYPTRFPSLICGNNHVGVVTYKTPVDTSSLYDAYCYRLKEVSCDCGPEYVGDGDFCNGNLASVVATNANFSVFYNTLLKLGSSSEEGEGLMDYLSTPSASVTLFVPVDSGFDANQILTRRDVEYHISVNNSLHFYVNLEHGAVIRSRLGIDLSVSVSTASSVTSSVSLPSKLVNSQRIIDWDIPATNGIIHVIEGPLKAPPPAVMPNEGTGRASAPSGSGVTGPVLIVCLLIGAGVGLAYYFLKRKKDPYQFQFFKGEENEGSHEQEESRPALVSIPNPLYREESQSTLL